MKVYGLKINHLVNPLGYLYETLTASYLVEDDRGKRQESARIQVADGPDFHRIVCDTGRSQAVSGLGTRLSIALRPRQRYYWKVEVWDELGFFAESDPAWFETGLMEEGFRGMCISPDADPSIQPVFFKEFKLEKKASWGRLYLTCLGVYEAYLNGIRISDEVLAPGLTVYHRYVQYQTYDVGELLVQGRNRLEVHAGDGWYKGMYGYRQNEDYRKGKRFQLLADLYVDGKPVLWSDLSWSVKRNQIYASDIYDGEGRDDTKNSEERFPVVEGSLDKENVKERLGQPVRVKEILRPAALLATPAGETVLDMGQNMVGRVAFRCREQAGRRVSLEHGEVLQGNCFYRDNYRTAKARFDYVSDGEEKEVRACLCFFGFRYVRLTGFTDARLEDFLGEVLYTDLERTGYMETGNETVNRLISNILWSQKGNFLDIPTDCPQRDEKMGWTGDAQIFAKTAMLNMDCFEFFRKYTHDIALEQQDTGGLVPQIVPSVGRNERTSAAWGDAAVIIPWTLYLHYGDPAILEERYESMKGWIGYIDGQNRAHNTNPNLWKNGFHYGDWLALDGGYYHMPRGGTDECYVSSAYFYQSVWILAGTAEVLGYEGDYRCYSEKAEEIRSAIRKEYFTGSGRLAIDTQTACVVAIAFGLARGEEMEPVREQLLTRLRLDGYCLKTGFVGTPLLLKVLSLCGRDDLAYRIFLNQGCPGWLYPVKLGATTMWERWDALNPDGSMSDTGMNSLNHYANGSVQEWMYEYVAGLRQAGGKSGWKRVAIAPRIHPEIGWMEVRLMTAGGRWEVRGDILEGGRLRLRCRVPFDAQAEVSLPHVEGEIRINGSRLEGGEGEAIRLDAGEWIFEYRLKKEYRPCFHLTDSVKELVRDPEIKAYLYEKAPMLAHTEGADIQNMTLPEMAELPFFLGIGTRLGLEKEVLQEIEEYISQIPKRFGK